MAQDGYDDIYGDLYGSDDEESKPVVLAGSTASGPSTSTSAPISAPAAAPAAAPAVLAPAPTAGGYGAPMQGVQRPAMDGAPSGGLNQQQGGQQGGGGPGRPDVPEEGKMFIGGLNWDTNDDSLRTYFSQFGNIVQSNIMRDQETGRSRGFAFLTYEDKSSVDKVLSHGEHYLDGKTIDPKRAVPRSSVPKSDKLFVRLLPQSCTPESFKAYWMPYGTVTDATLMMDKETGRHRGFGFVNFESGESTEKVLASGPHYMDGNLLEVKRAQTKGEQRRPDYGIDTRHLPPTAHTAGGGGGGAGGAVPGVIGMPNLGGLGGGFPGMPGGGMGMPAMNAPFDPSAMSKFFAQMGWGAWNPMMMPGMGMGAAGAGGGLGAMGGFDPMMGMGAMMGMQGMGGGMPGMGGMQGMGGVGVGGGGGSPGTGGDSGFAAPMRGGAGPNMRGGGVGGFRGGARGGFGGRGGHQGGAGPSGGAGTTPDGGAGPQRNAGRGAGFHPYSR